MDLRFGRLGGRPKRPSRSSTLPSNEPADLGLEKGHFILRVRRPVVPLTDKAPLRMNYEEKRHDPSQQAHTDNHYIVNPDCRSTGERRNRPRTACLQG